MDNEALMVAYGAQSLVDERGISSVEEALLGTPKLHCWGGLPVSSFPHSCGVGERRLGGHLCPTRTSAGLVSGLPGMMANRRHGWRNYCKVASPRSSCTQAGWLLFPPSLQHHLLWRFFFSFFLQLGHFNQSGNHVLRPQINGPWEGRRMVSAEPPWLPLQRNHLPASASLRSSFLGFSALLKAASFKSTSWQQVRTRQNQWLKLVFFMCKSPACQQGLGILFLLLKKIIYVFIYGCAGS